MISVESALYPFVIGIIKFSIFLFSFRRLGHGNSGPVLNITYGEEMEDGTWKMVICINKTTRTRCMPAILAPGKWRVSADIRLAVKLVSGIKACTWLREISSCSCLTVLPGPAWVLLNKICKD